MVRINDFKFYLVTGKGVKRNIYFLVFFHIFLIFCTILSQGHIFSDMSVKIGKFNVTGVLNVIISVLKPCIVKTPRYR